MKTPAFWYTPAPSLASTLLTPVSWLYALGRALHVTFTSPKRAPLPVLCVGNLTAGGSGKTPTAISLMSLVKTHGIARTPCFLTRGYGGTCRGPLLVDTSHRAEDIGDEALLLARHAPTIVAKDRYAGALLAKEHGADLLIMDDGLQNRSLEADINVLVVNGEMGFGNGKLIPAGPLRESIKNGLRAIDFGIVINQNKEPALSGAIPFFNGKIKNSNNVDKSINYVAFAGLGYPQKFFDFLTGAMKLNVQSTISFADHHTYTEQDMKKLQRLANQYDARLLTTEKDYVRIPDTAKESVDIIAIKLDFGSNKKLVAFLKEKCAAVRQEKAAE